VGIVLVLAIAVAVGVLVYRLTDGGQPASAAPDAGPAEPDEAAWGGGAPPQSARPEVPEGYIPVSEGAPSWHARLGGAMGLVIAVAVGAIGLAFSLWALVELISRLFADA
jgi:hypothetical protein